MDGGESPEAWGVTAIGFQNMILVIDSGITYNKHCKTLMGRNFAWAVI